MFHSRKPTLRTLVGLVFPAVALLDMSVVSAQGEHGRGLLEDAKQLYTVYWDGFGSAETHLLYHHRLDGPRGVDALSSPEDIEAGIVCGQSLPWGYGSGIQDVALENGQLLFALCEAYEATGDLQLARWARSLFQGLRLVATVSPEPGFVPRGPHPNGRSYYRDSSRDQHAAMAEALWRYGRCSLATDDDRRFIRGELLEMARRLESNDWSIRVEDGSHIAHVGFTWKQMTSVGAVSQLSFLSMVVDSTEDEHWRDAYRRSSLEDDSRRWSELLHPSIVADWKPFTLYSNQFSQALAILRRTEPDPIRQNQIAALLRALARRAIESNVFDATRWRRLDWAGGASEAELNARVRAIGFDMDRPTTVTELIDGFDPRWMETNPPCANKLCFGLPTAAFHKAMLSEEPDLINRISPHIEKMVRIMQSHGRHYHVGENFNRTAVLALLLVAHRAKAEDFERQGSDRRRS